VVVGLLMRHRFPEGPQETAALLMVYRPGDITGREGPPVYRWHVLPLDIIPRISQLVLARLDLPGRVAARTVGVADVFLEAWASRRRLLPRLHEWLPMSRLWCRTRLPSITHEAVEDSCRPGNDPTATSTWREVSR
jgi:hypothetical protein